MSRHSPSALFGRISRRAAIKAIFTGAAVLASVPNVPSGQRYFIAIDPASDKGDHYAEAIFRIDESGVTLISMKTLPNANVLRPNASDQATASERLP
jgi:hypothetical protein